MSNLRVVRSCSAVDSVGGCASWAWPLQNPGELVKLTNTRDRFEVNLDVRPFASPDIDIKVSGRDLLISCRNCSRGAGETTVPRIIRRSYKLPTDLDMRTIKTNLSSRGVLKITASKK
ncbi:hypothetical protein AB6A40_007386 [Gnathostoma spinigerum]|uniref:SHSP domain-containing protein n=1 Tax=Gnathostoma spinigerum TaxID=75299 RepID=A0ABD6EVS6_9BILA